MSLMIFASKRKKCVPSNAMRPRDCEKILWVNKYPRPDEPKHREKDDVVMGTNDSLLSVDYSLFFLLAFDVKSNTRESFLYKIVEAEVWLDDDDVVFSFVFKERLLLFSWLQWNPHETRVQFNIQLGQLEREYIALFWLLSLFLLSLQNELRHLWACRDSIYIRTNFSRERTHSWKENNVNKVVCNPLCFGPELLSSSSSWFNRMKEKKKEKNNDHCFCFFFPLHSTRLGFQISFWCWQDDGNETDVLASFFVVVVVLDKAVHSAQQ